MPCPKCKSDDVYRISSSYPKAYECNACGNIFTTSPQSLTDDS